MQEYQASKTALGVSILRAVHQMIDEVPPILEDPISSRLLDTRTIRRITREPDRYRSLQSRALRSHVVLRSRYAEDKLHLAVKAGVKQFVNLGAGYDTFSCRQPEWAHDLIIVELDHPATQSAKINHFKGKKINFPKNVEFLPLDLEKDNLGKALSHSNIDLSLPAYVSCLGVLAYLKRETVHGIFQSIAGMPAGSGFVFAFAQNKSNSLGNDFVTTLTAQKAAEQCEPWLSRFDIKQLKKELYKCGFSEISFLEPSDAKSQYYAGRKDLPAPRTIRLCIAEV